MAAGQGTPTQSAFEQMEKLSRALAVEYRRTWPLAKEFLTLEQLSSWEEEGVAIAKNSFRSWEAATEYFRVTPQALSLLRYQPFLQWARWGRFLSRDSAALASSYFRASPGVLGHLRAEEMGNWARLGRRLYKGTWKSGLLACAFFEASPKIVSILNLEQLEDLIHFLDALAVKSHDVAAECLGIAHPVLQQIEPADRKGLLSFVAALAESQWRDARACFEAGPRILPRVERNERGRFLALARRLARFSAADALSLYFEGSKALSEVHLEHHRPLMALLEQVVALSPPAAIDFLRSAPTVLRRVRPVELNEWTQEGLRLLREHVESGQAFFRLQSASGQEYLRKLSTRVDLQEVREVLRMYSHALTGMQLQVLSTENLIERGIGWTEVEKAATEGTSLYLPPFMDSYDTKQGNFDFYKVLATHQGGHLEFESFSFTFDRQGNLLPSRRHELARLQQGSAPRNRESDPSSLVPGLEALEQVVVSTDLSRFYDLFPDRQLISDLFLICEDTRVDARLKGEYKGLRLAYSLVQSAALAQRRDPQEMPLQEAILEILVRFSLDAETVATVLLPVAEALSEAVPLLYTLHDPRAATEDAAEVALRLYELISPLENLVPEVNQPQAEIQIQPEKGTVSRMPLQGAVAPRPMEGEREEQPVPYHSPQNVDFRGEFKPELVQILLQLRDQMQQGSAPDTEAGQLQEALQELLEKNSELAVADVEEGQIKQSSRMFVTNLIREAKRQQQAQEPKNVGTSNLQIRQPDSRPLQSDERAFFYDEWDYRVRDYRPRWCLVREHAIPEGNRDFFERTLRSYSQVLVQIRKQFEILRPELFRKVKRLADGEEFDLDALIEDMVDRRAGNAPSEKIYWRRNKIARDVAVVFLLDMSASTAEDIDEARRRSRDWDDDPWDASRPRSWQLRRPANESYRRIIDVEKESLVLLISALETIGDTYGIYGFSGYGRDNVEFYIIKDIAEQFGESIERKIDKIAPVRGTRMGPAIRHATTTLEALDSRTKILFLLSDGRPQDLGYGQDGTEKEYAIHDTHMALVEAKRKGITPFALTVDKAGHDYLKQMCDDMGYEVLADIESLPLRLPSLYRRLTR